MNRCSAAKRVGGCACCCDDDDDDEEEEDEEDDTSVAVVASVAADVAIVLEIGGSDDDEIADVSGACSLDASSSPSLMARDHANSNSNSAGKNEMIIASPAVQNVHPANKRPHHR